MRTLVSLFAILGLSSLQVASTGCGDSSADAPPPIADAGQNTAAGDLGGDDEAAESDTAITPPDTQDTGATPAFNLMHRGTVAMAMGTRRPQMVTTANGELLVAVLHPNGAPDAVGTIMHRAYRMDANMLPIGTPLTLTKTTEQFGEPTDHRMLLVDDELILVYQSLVYGDQRPPVADVDEESYAENQSLMMARFTLAGTEKFRGPILGNATEFQQDSFPDHCIAWRGDALIVATGGSSSITFRTVGIDGAVYDMLTIPSDPNAIGNPVGNGLFWQDSRLILTSGIPGAAGEPKPITFTEISPSFSVTPLGNFSPSGEDAFYPTAGMVHDGMSYVGYSAREAGAARDLASAPLSPRLAIFDDTLEIIQELKVSDDASSGHVYPSMTVIDNILYYAWTKQDAQDPSASPQVLLDSYMME